MYVYLVDAFVKKGPYARVLKTIENSLTDAELSGKVITLGAFSNPKAILHDEIRNGAKSVVCIGDENTFSRVLTQCADVDIVFGWIPVGREVGMSTILGVPYGADACKTLRARRVIAIDVLQVNDRYSIAEVYVPMAKVWAAVDGKYAMGPKGDGLEVAVCNLRAPEWATREFAKHVNPKDRQLEVFIRPLEKQTKVKFWRTRYSPLTVIPFEKMTVYSKTPFELFVDGQRSKETRVEISLAPHTVKLITGKRRTFF